MYELNLSDEARTVVGDLPHDAVKALAEFLEPDSGRLYRGPGSDLRTIAIADGQLLAVWLVRHAQRRVEILRLMWLGDEAGQLR